ncbi:MFS transporter [Pseudonocardia tropica]|uniref:MFS transporter n=1 Tax=Pseudonocardia tropica TaxID=681289 RepID=A0ABV1JYJ6_9PSEU
MVSSTDTRPTDTGARHRPGLTLGAVCAAIVLVPVTATGTPVALADISRGLGTGLTSAQWVVNAFFLTYASCMAISGSLADLTGRRRMFAGGVALFCASMLVAAFAPTIDVLVVARVVAGVGAACATTGGSALLAHSFDGRSRTRAFGAFGTAIGLGLAFGPLVAGVLVGVGGWRIFFLVAAVAVLPVLVLVPRLTESRDAHPAGPDWAGAVTFTVALTLLVFGFVEAPSVGWSSPWIIGSFVVAAGLLGVFVAIERRVDHPLIDVSLFTEPRFLAIAAMPVLLAFGFVALLTVLPAYFMATGGISALGAGLLLMLLTAPTLVVPLAVSAVAHRVPERLLLVTIMALQAAGAAWLTGIRPEEGLLALAGPLLLIGAGFGVSLAILDGAAVSAVEPARAGMAAGVFNTMRLGGEAISIAVLGSVLAAVSGSRLREAVGPASAGVTDRLLQGEMPADAGAAVRVAAAGAYTDALHTGLWAIAAVSVLGGIAVGLLGRPRTTPPGRADGTTTDVTVPAA